MLGVPSDEIVDRFIDAILAENLASIKTFLNDYPSLIDPTITISAGALHVCSEIGWIPGAEVLVRAGADVNGRNSCDATPLQIAVDKSIPEMVEWLLVHGADIAAPHPKGLTATFLAALNAVYGEEGEGMLELLLSKGARLDLRSLLQLGRTADVRLMLAEEPDLVRSHAQREELIPTAIAGIHSLSFRADARTGQPLAPESMLPMYREILTLLLAHGADINDLGQQGTPLHCAVSFCDPERRLIELLIDLGADVNKRRVPDGMTPLDVAHFAMSPTVSVLQAHGAVTTRPPQTMLDLSAPYLEQLAKEIEDGRRAPEE
jgi:ankyrin repeat protein